MDQVDGALIAVDYLDCALRNGDTATQARRTCGWWHTYASQDGGFSWEWGPDDVPTQCIRTTHITQPDNPAIQYRWQPADVIERSIDGGNTWVLEYDLAELRQDVRVDFNHFYPAFEPGPLTGAIDPVTDNLVLAMGWDGVLIRTQDGQWHWEDVGRYGLVDIHTPDRLRGSVGGHWWLAGAITFLIVTSSTAYIRQRMIPSLQRWMLISGWIGWGVLYLGFGYLDNAFPRGPNSEQILLLVLLGSGVLSLLLLIFFAIPLSIGAVWDIARNFRRYAGTIFLNGLGVSGLYLLPLVLWAAGTIPRYTTALIFSLLLVAAGLYAAYNNLKSILPILPRRDPLIEESAPSDPDEVDGG